MGYQRLRKSFIQGEGNYAEMQLVQSELSAAKLSNWIQIFTRI